MYSIFFHEKKLVIPILKNIAYRSKSSVLSTTGDVIQNRYAENEFHIRDPGFSSEISQVKGIRFRPLGRIDL
jgi:hypothetical protein